jgi:hypothetical protein
LRYEKFGEVYLFDEYHWDTGEPFGTAVPKKELERAPQFLDNEEKLKWLIEVPSRYSVNEWTVEMWNRMGIKIKGVCW